MITERDITILRQLVRLRFLNTYQIESIVPYNGKTQINTVVRRRMRMLEKEGLVKSFRPDAYKPKIYHLSDQGVEWCRKYFGIEEIKFYRRTALVPHILKIVDLYVSLFELQREGFALEKFITDFSVKIRGSDFKPDCFFSVNKDKRSLGFVEIDMGTESLKRIIKTKLLNYEDLYKSNTFQDKYGLFPTVYFFTNSNERAENLRLRLDKEKTTDINIKVATFEALNNILSLLGGLE